MEPTLKPQLFDSPEARTSFETGLKNTLREFLNKRWQNNEGRQDERLLSGYTLIGARRPMKIGSKLVSSEGAALFLDGRITINQLRSSVSTLLDNTTDWSLVRVKTHEGKVKQETPYYYPLADLDNDKNPTDSDGFVMKEQGPLNADKEYREHESALREVLKNRGTSLFEVLRFHGLNDQAGFVEGQLEGIRRAYIEKWFDGLKRRFTEYTLDPDKLLTPGQLGRKLFFHIDLNGFYSYARLERVLEPVVWVTTGELKANMIQNVSTSNSGDTNPERLERKIKGYLVTRKQFKNLKPELDIVVSFKAVLVFFFEKSFSGLPLLFRLSGIKERKY